MVSEKELKEFANEQSKTIVIRTYVDGCSYDTPRKSTKREQTIIQAVIYGALLAIEHGADKQSVKDSSEFTADILLPEMNGYDTIYNRIEKYFEITAQN